MGKPTTAKQVAAITSKKRKGHYRIANQSNRRQRTLPVRSAISPQKFDVVMGKGPGWSNHPGNERYLARIASCSDRYDAAKSIVERRSIRKEIVDSVREKGGRFVKFQNAAGIWVEVEDDKAVNDKISMSFRNYRRPSHHHHDEEVNGGDKKNQATPGVVVAAVPVQIMDQKPAAPARMLNSNEELSNANCAFHEQFKQATPSRFAAAERSKKGLFMGAARCLPSPDRQPQTVDNGSGHMLHTDAAVNPPVAPHSLIEACPIDRAREALRSWLAKELLVRLLLLEAITKNSNIR